MHSLYYLLVFSLICVLYPLPTLAKETVDNEPTTTSPDAVLTDTTPSPLRRSRHRRSTTETCPTSYFQCGNGLPSNFCCANGNTCQSAGDDTSVLCCPDGKDCSQIEPITCTIAFQNATAYPTLAVHTTNLTGQLPTCGAGCCPFGYTCNDSSLCVRTKDETLITEPSSPSSAATATVSSAASTSTALIVASTEPASTSAPAGSTSSSSSSSGGGGNSSSSSHRTIGIAAGSAVAGVASIGAVIAFACIRRRRTAEPKPTAKKPVRVVSISQFSPTPPPLPEKEPHQVARRKKRKSLLSWVPSIVNRTPAELPATPVSFSAWNAPWGQEQVQRPTGALRPYPRDSLTAQQVYELEARWLPQEGADQERQNRQTYTEDMYIQERYTQGWNSGPRYI